MTIALSFSGGKDSLACVYLLRDLLGEVVVYHNDTGDLLPETRAIVEHARGMCPNFVHIQGDVLAWQKEHGLPTDLFPHSAEQVGQEMGEGVKLTTRYHCCTKNLMLPLWERIYADGHRILIRGTKRCDMPRLPMESGDIQFGVTLWLPLLEWSNEAVMAYLRHVGAPINPIYEHVTNSPECARCSAWWGEKRAAYLRDRHPELYADYRDRLHIVSDAIQAPLANLRSELEIMQ